MPNGIRAVQSDTPEVLLEFLEVCFNSILFNRKVYPASIFVLKKKYSIPVHVSIFPDLNQYIFQVLSAVKHVYIANELKLISLCILNEDFVPIEKYNFNFGAASNPWPSSTLQATSSNKTLVDLSDIYDSFRSFCLKLSVLDNSLKCTKNTSFKIYIETKESAQHKIFKEPQFENFPWIPERAANGETEAELIPLNTISTVYEHMANEERIGSLEEEALKRKERLKNLKKKTEEHGNENKPMGENFVLPKPKFRSYKPEDEKLQENIIPSAQPGDVVAEVKDHLEAANSRVVIEELDLANLAPRKPDWDLKRDVAKKLERLEKRTQRAIAELIRERLKTGQADLATSVNIGSRANQDDVDED